MATIVADRDLPPAPPRPAPRPKLQEERERLIEIRRADGQLGEHVDIRRFSNGVVALSHVIPGMSHDALLLTPDDAAKLTAFLVRPMRAEGCK